MTNTAITTARLRAALLAGSACAALSTAIAPAAAQDGAGPQKVEKVVVTGSRIVRKNLESTNTTSIVTTDQIYRNGSANVADVFNSLPQFGLTFSRSSTTFSGTAASGLNLANLRNIGSVATLTLINGRRVPSGNITGSAVDLNVIPSANIERIEVLTGGASAVYGADAVAGVVNIITKKNFNGLSFGASYGASRYGDNINPRGFASFGSDLGAKGHFGVTAEYEFQGQVVCKDRFLCAEDFAWGGAGTAVNRGPNAYSAVAPQGTFIVDGTPALAQQAWTLRNNVWVQPFVAATDGYNRNARRGIAQPTSRLLFQAEADYEVLPGITAFAEVNYGSSKTDSVSEGQPFQSIPTNGIGGPAPFPGLEVTIPFDNPFIPTDIRNSMIARGDTALSWQQRFDIFGLRGNNSVRQMHRVAGGLKGEFDSLLGLGDDWSWELSYVFGRSTQDGQTEGLVDLTHLYAGLRVEPSGVADNLATPDREDLRCVDPVQRALGCVPINPFGGSANGSYTDRMINYIKTSGGLRGTHETENATAYLTGSLFELPAGPVQAVFGAEWRRTLGDIDYSDGINIGQFIGNIILDGRSQNKWQEMFTEMSVPLISDASFTKELRLEGSYRRTHADGQGSYDTWKYGGVWEPIGGVKLRGVQSRAIRAPNTGEQAGGGQTFGAVTDPCSAPQIGANANRTANCLADGFNLGPYNPPLVVIQNVGGYNFGNPDVKPEIADTLTYGLVITPELIPGLSLTVDRFDIQIDKQIALVGRQLTANLCYDLPAAERGIWCAKVKRGPNPNVLLPQAPPIPANPAQYANIALSEIFDEVSNNTTYKVKGVDIEFNYRTDLADWVGETDDLGTLTLGGIISLYDEASALVSVPGAAPNFTDYLGFSGGQPGVNGQLERMGKFTVDYALDDWRLTLTSRYIDESINSPLVAVARRVTIPDAWYHNVQGVWNFGESYQLYAGVTNVMDREPPFFPTATSPFQALDTVPQLYDVYGRSYYAGFRVRFE